ncbi:retrovirus-related pol polyprotein LINE-1 [Tanacetum coccineum]
MRVGNTPPRILWKNLNGDAMEAFRSRVAECVSTQAEAISTSDADTMWNIMACIIKDAAKDTLGVAIWTSKTHTACRKSWWPCEDVQSKVAVKQASHTQAKEKAYEELYKRLDSKDGENDIFSIVKTQDKRRRDRGPEGRKEAVDPSIQPQFECYYSRISQAKMRTSLQKMGIIKDARPNQIPMKAWRSLGDEGIFWLTSLFNKIFTSAKMHEEWRLSDVNPIFKNKDDAQVCSNYTGIKLLGHTMKLWERVIERRLRRETTVSKNQFGFMLGRSSVEAIHLIRSLMENYRERQRNLHLAFLDLEKAYDSVPRELIWKTLIEKGTPRRYIRVIMDMQMLRRPVPYLFVFILDELSRGIQEDIPWCLMFVDDIMLVSESTEGLNNILENWREALEDNGLRINREKTKYLRCDFGDVEIPHNEEVDICVGDKILQPNESFRYLGSMLHKSGRINEDVAHRIKQPGRSGGRPHESFVIEMFPLS